MIIKHSPELSLSGFHCSSSTTSIALQKSASSGASKDRRTADIDLAYRQFDIRETSFHVYVAQIDMHLTDDNGAEADSASPAGYGRRLL